MVRFEDIANADFPVPESEANKVMHIGLRNGPNTLMDNDVPAVFSRANESGKTIEDLDQRFKSRRSR